MSAIATLLDAERSSLDRLGPEALARAMGQGALVVDIRPSAQRRAEGEMDGALVIERNVLEWRLDPTSPDCVREVTGREQVIIIVCSEGYASSLAAATLRRLGLENATDLEGGYQAWRRWEESASAETARDVRVAVPTEPTAGGAAAGRS
jgi:rhodanese-related sulfurtransferase